MKTWAERRAIRAGAKQRERERVNALIKKARLKTGRLAVVAVIRSGAPLIGENCNRKYVDRMMARFSYLGWKAAINVAFNYYRLRALTCVSNKTRTWEEVQHWARTLQDQLACKLEEFNVCGETQPRGER
jgi:hypothetical protein